MRYSLVLCIAGIFAMAGFSCKRDGTASLNQGEIHYGISYIGAFAFPTEALPSDLVISFKKDKMLFEMLGWGKSGIVTLANHEDGIYDTYYSLFGFKKLYYPGKENEIFPGFESMRQMNIKKTELTKDICGFKCKNAIVTFDWKPGKFYDIWYTDDIRVRKPNASTPFKDIDGVLMSFFFIMGKTEFHFSCENVYRKEIPDEVFKRKRSYTRVSKENMSKAMNGMLDMKP